MKVDLAEHMKNLWQEIGFKPTTFELPDLADEDTAGSKYEDDTVISDEKSFLRQVSRPDMQTDDINKIIGLQIRNFPQL